MWEGVKIAISEKKDGSTKFSGDKKDEIVRKTREIFIKKIGVDPSDVVSASLVHGARIVWAGRKDRGKAVSGADGLLTKEKDIFLSVTIADCLPVFLFDKKGKVVGLIHAGWRGISQHILRKAVREMQDGPRNNIIARIGPGICPRHFEIKEDALKKLSDYSECVIRERGRIFFDLKRAARNDLKDAGIAESNINTDKECTFCLRDKYFSLRREKEEIKKMMAVMGFKQRSS